MYRYFPRLKKIEFVVTDACTGHCAHCSQGNHAGNRTMLDPSIASRTVRETAALFDLETVMAFGGEPLLNADATCAIMCAATACGVPHRQVITNGYVTDNGDRMRTLIERLAQNGVNDLRLSVDAFHQQTIPLEAVRRFGQTAKEMGIPILLQPAWLVSRDNDNPYNRQTRALLDSFSEDGIGECEGNIVFPEGRARELLREYFADSAPENPYIEDPRDIRCLSVDADGCLLGGNLHRLSVEEILTSYDPDAQG